MPCRCLTPSRYWCRDGRAMSDFADFQLLLLTFGLALPRILGLFAVLPMFSQQLLPVLLRMSIAVALSIVVVPVVMPAAKAFNGDAVELFAVIGKEALIGAAIGFLVAILFWAIEAIGFYIDNQRGATMSSSMNPITGVDTSPLGLLLNQAMTVFFLSSGAFLLLLGGLYDSYALWPVTEFWPRLHPDGIDFFLGQLDRLMRFAVIMAAPVLLAMFLSELGLAMVSRFAPQLQVFFLAMPLKSGVGMVVLVLYVGFLFDYVRPELMDIAALFGQLDRLFR